MLQNPSADKTKPKGTITFWFRYLKERKKTFIAALADKTKIKQLSIHGSVKPQMIHSVSKLRVRKKIYLYYMCPQTEKTKGKKKNL